VRVNAIGDATLTHFSPNWESLKNYQVPDWFRDAKFGIFMHWGVQSVPANNGWYARFMYTQEGALWGNAYEYHRAHYGHPSEFGYKDLIPQWRAEAWDPEALVQFYKQIGARYIVPVAVHHDNFDNYDSTWQPWNSVNMGPHRDVVGEWKHAADKYGLRFGVSTHSDRTWDWFATAHGSDVSGDLKGVLYDGHLTAADGKGTWWDGYDPRDLYAPPHAAAAEPSPEYCEIWYKRTLELIDKYQPDLLYFDGPLPIVRPIENGGLPHPIRSRYGLEIAAHFYNANQDWHDGRQDAVLNIKLWEPGSVPDKTAIVLDIEKGQSDTLRSAPWQTDTSLIGEWYFAPGPLELDDTVVVHNLCDIVSKNGNLLLNVGLRADGTLPDDQRAVLLGIGRWLDLNGEAIYGTRPWKIFGEGPTKIEHGDFKQNKQPFTANDIRFTTKSNTLYAIALGWPTNGTLTVKSLIAAQPLWFGVISTVEMLGVTEPLNWSLTDNGLVVQLPDRPPCDYAYVLKIR
jgi:alpha-L-fucosidase